MTTSMGRHTEHHARVAEGCGKGVSSMGSADDRATWCLGMSAYRTQLSKSLDTDQRDGYAVPV